MCSKNSIEVQLGKETAKLNKNGEHYENSLRTKWEQRHFVDKSENV